MNRRTFLGSVSAVAAQSPSKKRNMIFVLTDDHRYDAMGFLGGQSWLRTPNMDRLAREGAHLKNAFVTTALCSPSRASILTGRYAHAHKIVDNNTAIPKGTAFFPEQLRNAGYRTAFMGKWHMGGESDAPQPGFDKWISFRGQGTYFPSPNGLNIDGRNVPQKGYITDELTDYAVDWIRQQPKTQPYFLYLSHKAVHGDFIPAARHKGKFKNEKFVPPATMPSAETDSQSQPQNQSQNQPQNQTMWVRNQRNSWHGVEYPYHTGMDIETYYRMYAETLLAVDESLGRVLDVLRERGELDSTLVIYMGDNGFAFGEHGLIDKRTAYEESMRVPMLARCPELFGGGRTVTQVVANLDIMPTVLETAGVPPPPEIDGRSFLPVLQGKNVPWRDALLYEYFWERNFPHTPTIHALRTDRYKYIRYHGIWDLDELYDLQEDPNETRNLIADPRHAATVKQMNTRLFDVLEKTDGMNMPLYRDKGAQQRLRHPDRSKAAPFPKVMEGPRNSPPPGLGKKGQ
jgi:N-acetylglucosamine-6-sulfatase